MVEEKDDWLFPKAREQKANQEEKGLVIAQKYLVFFGPTADPRARELLEQWTQGVRRKAIPPNATAQEYAFYEGQREFVEIIHAQIDFANKGVNQPKPRTT